MEEAQIAHGSLCPPFLREFGEEQWLAFRSALEVYRGQGGERPFHSLIAASAHQMLRELEILRTAEPSAEFKETDAVREISELFSPASKEDAHARFRSIRMTTRDYDLEAVLSYNRAYTNLTSVCSESVRLSDGQLRGLYMRGLRPERLANSVELHEPGSLTEAKKFAVLEVRRLKSMQATLGDSSSTKPAPGHTRFARPSSYGSEAWVRGSREHDARTATGAHSSSSGGHVIICRVCGVAGHKSFQCPQRQDRAQRSNHAQAPGHAPAPATATTPGSTRPSYPPGRPVTRGMTRAAQTAQTNGAQESKQQSFLLTAQFEGLSQTSATTVPRKNFMVRSREGERTIAIAALLDTGSEVSLVSSAVAQQLKQTGVFIRQEPRTLQTAGGSVTICEFISCEIRVEVTTQEGANPVWLPLTAGILDLGEDLLLGFSFLHSAGLLQLLPDLANAITVSTPTSIQSDCLKGQAGSAPVFIATEDETSYVLADVLQPVTSDTSIAASAQCFVNPDIDVHDDVCGLLDEYDDLSPYIYILSGAAAAAEPRCMQLAFRAVLGPAEAKLRSEKRQFDKPTSMFACI